MGLDVYLYRYDDADAVIAAEAKADQFSNATWEAAGEYAALTEAQKDAARAVIAEHNTALGLDDCGEDKTRKQKIEHDSTKHPAHMFKIGYFRSSYNSGGIDSIASNLIGMTLRDIFQAGDDYVIKPDWTLAREKAIEFHQKLVAAQPLRVATIGANPFAPPPKTTPADAITIAQREFARDASLFGGGSYSNIEGHFFVTPLAIRAAIVGIDVFGAPAVHLVYEDQGFDWYREAAEIVIETIDYVLAQPNIEQFRLHWSG